MQPREYVTLKRTSEATEIPSGKKITLFAGTELIVMQSLGGSYTVMTHQGQMASLSGKDGDAIGKEIIAELKPEEPKNLEDVERMVQAQLKTCYDPEIPHNILDLGLVYDCRVTPVEECDDVHRVDIKMTLTAPGCGMGEWLKQEVQNKVLSIPTVKQANVEIVFDPPWDRSKMHPALRREFGM
jgi:probable FeS assembly SUF system protein SufT